MCAAAVAVVTGPPLIKAAHGVYVCVHHHTYTPFFYKSQRDYEQQREAHTQKEKSFLLLKILSIKSITERARLDFLRQCPFRLPYFYVLKNKGWIKAKRWLWCYDLAWKEVMDVMQNYYRSNNSWSKRMSWSASVKKCKFIGIWIVGYHCQRSETQY